MYYNKIVQNIYIVLFKTKEKTIYCILAKIEDKSKHHFHALKHTTAFHLAECDMDIKELQWWLGHKSVSNTEIYFQFTTKQQERMYAKLEGKSELV